MYLASTIKVGVRSLGANKLRSFLAALGIIIGTGAVIAMLAIGSGAQKQVLARLSSLGANVMIITPGSRDTRGAATGTQQNLKLEDALAIAREVDGVSLVAPVVRGSAQVKYFNQNTQGSIFGTSASYFTLRDIQIDRGRIFTEREVERSMRVALIGDQIAQKIFGKNDPVGEVIKVNGIGLTVLGKVAAKGEGWGSPDNQVFIPYTTAMSQLLGVENLREIDVQAVSETEIPYIQQDVKTLLRKRHRTLPGAEDDFNIMNMDEIRKSASEVTNIFKYLLGGIAAISLIVGGIGIMNVMIVTVTERTREIGIRKAIGATEGNILMQFLVESVIVSGFGGLIGLLIGVGGALLIPKLGSLQTVVETDSALLALGVSAGIGIFFGLYPAWKASRLDPIEALRHE
ncbi:FtsX-like permease family protein [bacterium]|nr:MAG: FtsX-like permease family protein [bacterium]